MSETTIRESLIQGSVAAYRAGRLVGYPAGQLPESVVWRDGTWQPEDDRPVERGHDAKPWGFDPRLDAVLVECSLSDARWNQPIDRIEFAHKGKALGWDGGRDKGIGHWWHPSNFHQAWLRTGDSAALARYRDSVRTLIGRYAQICDLPPSRDLQTLFYEMWYAGRCEADEYVKLCAKRVATNLTALPLAQHEIKLSHPWYPLALLDCGAPGQWFIDGYQAVRGATETVPLIFSAIVYDLTGDPAPLAEQMPKLVEVATSHYRAPGKDCDWLGVWNGRRGDGFCPHQFLYFAERVKKAGLPWPEHPPVNGYPISADPRDDNPNLPVGCLVRGSDLQTGIVRTRSWGGDAQPVVLVSQNTGEELTISNPGPAAWQWQALYRFSAPCDSLRIQASSSQVLAPLSASPDEHAVLEPNKRYAVGRTRARIETAGPIAVECDQRHVTLYTLVGEPLRGLWAERDPSYALTPVKPMNGAAVIVLDLRGPAYGRLRLRAQAPAVWRPK